ncbi:MAG: aminotransferase class IV [Patescibacteria group bacterium]|nr:aminotransferase class IV [Patescibacteria group bacterium]
MFIFYVNGRFVEENEAKISVFDLGFSRGYGVFELLRTYNHKPFFLREHLRRLFRSARLIGLRHNYSLDELEKIIIRTLNKNLSYSGDFNIRVILTGGNSTDFITPTKPNLFVIITPFRGLSRILYNRGIKIITHQTERVLPQAKTLIYTEAVKLLRLAKKRGAHEVLLVDKKGKISECTTSNFFAVIDGVLVTPKLGNILPGITRQIVIKLAHRLKIPVIERDIYISEVKTFQECFITATNKEILPVVKIDNFLIVNSKAGKIIEILSKGFKNLAMKLCK